MAGITGTVALAWVLTEWATLIADKYKPNLIKFICLKCWSFWLGLIVTQNIFDAAICGLIGYALGEILLRIEQGKW